MGFRCFSTITQQLKQQRYAQGCPHALATGNNKKRTMIYIDYNTERMAPANNDRAKNEQKEMIDRMTDEFVYLVNLSEGTPLRWVNSTTDLVEVCHMACLTERLREESGQPLNLQQPAAPVLHAVWRHHARQPALCTGTGGKAQRHTPAVVHLPLYMAEKTARHQAPHVNVRDGGEV